MRVLPVNHNQPKSIKLVPKLNCELVSLKNSMRSFHENERGDNENLGRILILGLILIPIVILLTLYGQDIVDIVKEQFEAVIGEQGKIKK